MGSQWLGMGKDLMKIPVFEEAIEKCHNVLLSKEFNLKQVLTSEDPNIFDNILNAFVGIAATQIGLTDILKALGLEPDFIIGHSFGELGCGYADGCLTAEQTVRSAHARGVVSNETMTIKGAMAAVGLGYQQLKDLVPEEIVVACHNSSDSSTISGPASSVTKFVKDLKAKNFFAEELSVSNIAYHSKYIADMGPRFLAKLKDIIRNSVERSPKWISSSVPENKLDLPDAKYSSAQYHTNNLLGSVLFEEASKLLPTNAIIIEIAPHGLLQSILKGLLPNGTHIALTQRRNPQNVLFFLKAIGKYVLISNELKFTFFHDLEFQSFITN